MDAKGAPDEDEALAAKARREKHSQTLSSGGSKPHEAAGLEMQGLLQLLSKESERLRVSQASEHESLLVEFAAKETRGPKWSPRVLELQHAVKQLMKLQQAEEAKLAKQRLLEFQSEERAKFLESLTKQFYQREWQLVAKQAQERTKLRRRFEQRARRIIESQGLSWLDVENPVV